MKLEVGMYARVRRSVYGGITIVKIDKTNQSHYNGLLYDALKCGYSLLDVIDRGDYVNGLPVSLVFNKEYCVVIIKNPIPYNNDYEEDIHENEIISIVTKEQFENCKFKVEKEEYKVHSKVVEFDQFKNEEKKGE